MKRKLWSIVLCVCMTAMLVPYTTFAAESTRDAWDGTSDTSWYDGEKDEFHITTAEQLAGMAELINDDTTTFSGKTVYLDNDLDLGGHEWVSIGDGANTEGGTFQGIFDGQNHVIYNLYSHEGHKDESEAERDEYNLLRNGLFGAIFNATVQNLGIENADIVIPMDDTSTYGKGILVDWMTNSTIKNCYTTGSITGGSYTEKVIGGLVGFTAGNNTVSQCYSTAAITGNYNNGNYFDSLGGIVGGFFFNGQLTISDCWFGGKISVNSIRAAVGGIIGYGSNASITNCLVATKDLGDDGLGNTCWIGDVITPDATNCIWPADDKYGSTVSNETNGTSAGIAVNDFNSADVLESLQTNAESGVTWVYGISHPTFEWDERNISANYEAVDEAIKKAEALNADLYANYSDVTAAIEAVDRNISKAGQAEVDAMAKAIEDAIDDLEYKDADYSKVDEAIAKAGALNKDDYKDFSKVEAAIAAVVRDKKITEQAEVDAMAKAIEDAISALEKKAPVKPTNPSNSDKGNTASPQTGDSSNIALWIAFLVASGTALTGIGFYNRKKKYN